MHTMGTLLTLIYPTNSCIPPRSPEDIPSTSSITIRFFFRCDFVFAFAAIFPVFLVKKSVIRQLSTEAKRCALSDFFERVSDALNSTTS